MEGLKPRFLNVLDIELMYRDSGFEFLKRMEGKGNSITDCLKKDVEKIGTVYVNLTNTTLEKRDKDWSSYGKVITEIKFPAIVNGENAKIKSITFEHDRTPKGLVPIGYVKEEWSKKADCEKVECVLKQRVFSSIEPYILSFSI
ncbi:MAG: hypothetical protein ABIE55_00815 [Candidatus Aenigmatarchaeota archaeon]